METKPKRDYLMFKIRGRLVKVDPDIFYKIINTRHFVPDKKYNGDIASMRITSEGYAVIIRGEKPPQRHILLSRFIMNPKKGEIDDHINRNPLDNRRVNLRIVNKRQNNLNKKCKNGSGFIGVSIKNRKGRKYCSAKLQLSGGKQLSFQLPDSPHNRVIAAFARDRFVLQMGEEDFAPLNFPCFKNEPFRSFLLQEDLRKRAEKRAGD
ncbi:MAG: HNH endonuclease [Phycisphaerae bacterium]|nr:HNH endonuclease [Phycisphaerae bacterium]